MLNTYALLELTLLEIEKNIKNKVNADSLARAVPVSSAHLQRLFRLAFEVPLASYIRARKLAASLEALLKTDLRVIDIAAEYGFGYEQSYIRAFKREFGATPGEARAAGHIIPVMPPLQLAEKNKIGDGLLFGPDFVMVPTFHVVGRRHVVPYDIADDEAPRLAKDFWFNFREAVPNRLGDDIYIGLTRVPPGNADFSYYLPSVPVSNTENPPPATLEADTFPASLCAKFHYIGQHHYFDLNAIVAEGMYNAIWEYENSPDAKYRLAPDIYFERINKADYDGVFCKLEWFTPVIEKN